MNNTLSVKIKEIAANIRHKREYRNYTQEYLALKLNISQNAYSKMEMAKTKLSLQRLYEIADILDIPPGELLGITLSAVSSYKMGDSLGR